MKAAAGDILRWVGRMRIPRIVLSKRSIGRDELLTTDTAVWTTHRFGDRITVTYSSPETSPPYPEKIEDRFNREYTIGAPFVAQFPNAQLVGRRGLAIASDGRFVKEASALANSEVLLQNLALTVADRHYPGYRQRASDSIGSAVSLVGSWNFGYFHWTTDWLARLASLHRYEEETGTEPMVIVPPEANDWMLSALKLAGIPSDRWYLWDGNRLDVDNLLVPSVPRIVHDEAADDVDVLDWRALTWLRSVIQENTAEVSPPNRVTNRLYVSRNDADSRQVINESEVLEVLQQYGFSRIVPSNLTVPEQVAAFREADVIIGPHGAGLTNALYANDSVLLEFFGHRTATCYLTLCEHLPVSYGLVNAEAVGTNMTIAPSDILEALDSMGVRV